MTELSVDYIRALIEEFKLRYTSALETTDILTSRELMNIYNKSINSVAHKFPLGTGYPSKSDISKVYISAVRQGAVEVCELFDAVCTTNNTRSSSGVTEITVPMGGVESCSHDCHMCPDKNGTARSYLPNEGTFVFGARENFDPFRMVLLRMIELADMGHIIDKIALIILGGTFHTYPKGVRDHFITSCWRACNLFQHLYVRGNGRYADRVRQWIADGHLRNFKSLRTIPGWDEINDFFDREYPMGDIQRFKKDNETVSCARCVELSIETRPDMLTMPALMELRYYGCTRIQIGIQTLDEKVLLLINRGHKAADALEGIRNALDMGYKVDGHLMIGLPGSTLKKDMDYITWFFRNVVLDYVKIYFCLNLPYTEIRKWYNRGLEMEPERREWIDQLMSSDSMSDYDELVELASSEGKKLKDILVWVPYIEKISQDDFNKAVDQIVMMIPPCTRLVRLQRDFVKSKAQFKTPDIEEILPEETDDDMSLCGWVSSKLHSNEAQLIDNRLKKSGHIPIEIKSREIRNTYIKNLEEGAYIYCIKHMNMDRLEYYVSVEYPSVPGQYTGSYTLGHVRCRIQPQSNMLQVRELHVYGMVKPASSSASSKLSKQHRGFGKILMRAAETIAMHHGCTTVQVISGVGVRDYYRRLGYSLTEPGEYMTLTPGGPSLNLNLPQAGEVAVTPFREARSVPVKPAQGNRRTVVLMALAVLMVALVLVCLCIILGK